MCCFLSAWNLPSGLFTGSFDDYSSRCSGIFLDIPGVGPLINTAFRIPFSSTLTVFGDLR